MELFKKKAPNLYCIGYARMLAESLTTFGLWLPLHTFGILMEDTIFSCLAAKGSMNFGYFPSTICLRAVTRYFLSDLSLLKRIYNLNASTFCHQDGWGPIVGQVWQELGPIINHTEDKQTSRAFLLPGWWVYYKGLHLCVPAYTHQISKCWNYVNKPTHVFVIPFIGEGNGNPLQCSCLENPRDGGAWWAAFYGVAQSQTRLKQLSSSSGFLEFWYWNFLKEIFYFPQKYKSAFSEWWNFYFALEKEESEGCFECVWVDSGRNICVPKNILAS